MKTDGIMEWMSFSIIDFMQYVCIYISGYFSALPKVGLRNLFTI